MLYKHRPLNVDAALIKESNQKSFKVIGGNVKGIQVFAAGSRSMRASTHSSSPLAAAAPLCADEAMLAPVTGQPPSCS